MNGLFITGAAMILQATLTVADVNPLCPRNFFRADCSAYCERGMSCNGHGDCGRDGECVCYEGYEGHRCEHNINDKNDEKKEWKCTAWGDPHLISFFGEKFDYHAEGWSLLYHHNDARVVVEQYECARGKMACIDEVHVVSGGISVAVKRDGSLSVISADDSGAGAEPVPISPRAQRFGNVNLVDANKRNKKNKKQFVFEIKTEGVDLLVTLTLDKKLMDVVIEHQGTLDGVRGICNDACSTEKKSAFKQTDCSRILSAKYRCEDEDVCTFGTVVPSIEPVPEEPEPGTPEPLPEWPQLLWAFDCCMPYRKCSNNDELFSECVEENSRLQWTGSKEESTCSDSFEAILIQDGLCQQEVCPPNFVGPACNRCKKNYYGENCDHYCSRDETCSGHGTCNGQGRCWCDSGYSGSDIVVYEGQPEQVVECFDSQPVVLARLQNNNQRSCLDLTAGGRKSGVQLQQWTCYKTNKNQQWELVEAPEKDGSFIMRNIKKRTCVVVDDRNAVRQGDCDIRDIKQRFELTSEKKLVFKKDGKCMKRERKSSSNGVKLLKGDCSDDDDTITFEFLRGEAPTKTDNNNNNNNNNNKVDTDGPH